MSLLADKLRCFAREIEEADAADPQRPVQFFGVILCRDNSVSAGARTDRLAGDPVEEPTIIGLYQLMGRGLRELIKHG